MASDEFSLIEKHFSTIGPRSGHTRLGLGDDAAVQSVPFGYQLVSSMDTLIAGVHFPFDTAPGDIAAKALAVNLSDLAAMAADPAWFLLSLSLPESNPDWLTDFSAGLQQIADQYQIELIGGDTCRGDLSITIQIMGLVPEDSYVTRAGARKGDLVLVSGCLGNAALGLAHLQGDIELPEAIRGRCIDALQRPMPRLELGSFLRDYARAAIDLSDGLQADLGHILQASRCGAIIERDRLPVDNWIRHNEAWQYALTTGDDYEICCCISADQQDQIDRWNQTHPGCPLTQIGKITKEGYKLHHNGQTFDIKERTGYRHFA